MTAAMTEVIVKVMAEVLCILAITTREIKESRTSEFRSGDGLTPSVYFSSESLLKKLVGRQDIEDALQRLDKVTTEEARMVAAEALATLHGVSDKVIGVNRKVHGVHKTLKAVEDMLQGVDGRVKDIGDKIINGANAISSCSSVVLTTLIRIGLERLERQIEPDFYAVSRSEKGSKVVHDVGDDGQTEEPGEVRNRASNIDEKKGAMKDIVARIIDGARVFLSQ